MSDWGNYTSCSKECGWGHKTRSRQIVVEPKFGGEKCPGNLKESTICKINHCEEEKSEAEREIEEGLYEALLYGAGASASTMDVNPLEVVAGSNYRACVQVDF